MPTVSLQDSNYRDVATMAETARRAVAALQGARLSGDELEPGRRLHQRPEVDFQLDGDIARPGRNFVRSLMADPESLGSFVALLQNMGFGGSQAPLPAAPRMSGYQLVDAASEPITLAGSYAPGDYILVTVAFTGEGPVTNAGQVLSQPGSVTFTIDGQSLNGGQGVPFIYPQRGIGVTFIRVERPGTTLVATITSKLIADDEAAATVNVFPDEPSARAWLALFLGAHG